MADRSAIAIGAHPDDIEMMMAGTLRLLGEAGFRLHYVNISTGSCGSLVHGPAALRRIRRREAKKAAAILGATFHESRAEDLEIQYALPLLRWLTGVIRLARPSIVLTHSPQDYMEDHMNACRLAVTATFARGMPNFAAAGRGRRWRGDAVVYHAMPVGFCDGLRQRIVPGAFVDVSSVHETKLAALASHESQRPWLQATRGMDSLARSMEEREREMGRRSRRFRFAEGWRRHSHLGFGAVDADPLRDALGRKFLINHAYERRLARV
jgi:LmbE family N-acetylglucosaminyl deacetylase